eukprot:GDKJ01033730.1.p3 GENE.GDKJ01033730.1~~GDKJ01033730.1.p3  ORF type:complete len:149 (+),score=17.07 GDKJ01033730.1:1881-2327(+)
MKHSKYTLEELLIQEKKLEKKLFEIRSHIHHHLNKDVIEISWKKNWANFSGNESEDLKSSPKPFRYDLNGKWKDKILYVIVNAGNPLTASEITRLIYENEENKDMNYDPIVRLNINRLVKKVELVKFKIKNLSNYYYALPNWKLDKYI